MIPKAEECHIPRTGYTANREAYPRSLTANVTANAKQGYGIQYHEALIVSTA